MIIKPEIYYRILKIFLLTISSTSSCKFLQEDENCSDVAYSKYHNLFFIRLLNFCGFFSRSMWNLLQIAASWKNEKVFIHQLLISLKNCCNPDLVKMLQSTYHPNRKIVVYDVKWNVLLFFWLILLIVFLTWISWNLIISNIDVPSV